jgi:hypothetical protein
MLIEKLFHQALQGIRLGAGHGFPLGADADLLVPAALAADDVDCRFRPRQGFGEQFDALLVGRAFHRWGGQPDFKGILMNAGKGGFGGAWLDIHPEGQPLAVFPDVNHRAVRAGGG